MARRYASYEPALTDSKPAVPITDVGGYDELLHAAEQSGVALEVSRAGLAVLDAAISVLPEGLEQAVGMFFGDVVIHSIPGSQWRVVSEGRPLVEVPGGKATDVLAVAKSSMTEGRRTLIEVFDHLEEIGGQRKSRLD
jgi:hypothetical protein